MDPIVKSAREHYLAYRHRPVPIKALEPDNQWYDIAERVHEYLLKYDSPIDYIHMAQSHSSSGFNHRSEASESHLRQRIEYLKEEFPDYETLTRGIEESEHSTPKSFMMIDGKRCSNIHLWHLRPYLRCRSKLELLLDDIDDGDVLEIGAGMGELARIFMLSGIVESYTIVDIPSSLFFAEVYLRHHFPDMPTFYGEYNRTAVFNFVPINEFESIESDYFDIAINQGSFQEMAKDTVIEYMQRLHALNIRYVYSLNYDITPLCLDGWRIISETQSPRDIIMDADNRFRETCLERC